MFKGMVAAATFAILLAGAALTHSADAAVCRAGYYWDAVPVSVDIFGNCIMRNGLIGVISLY
jgi:hypothetical protein